MDTLQQNKQMLTIRVPLKTREISTSAPNRIFAPETNGEIDIPLLAC